MDYLSKIIMYQSRHQFIYGDDGQKRETFLKNLEKEFPITVNDGKPCAIYMRNYTLPNLECANYDTSDLRASIIGRNFISLAVIENILNRIIYSTVVIDNNNVNEFINRINTCFIRNKSKFVRNLDELLTAVQNTKQFYYDYYSLYITGEKELTEAEDIPMSYIDATRVVEWIKKMLNKNSYFGIIIDQQTKIPIISQKSINCFVTSRCNADLSMKIACDIKKWDTYFDLNGTLAEAIHDYGDEEFDDNVKRIEKGGYNGIKKR